MQIINLDHEGQEPVDGDRIRIIYDNGATEEKQYWSYTPPPPPQPTVPSSITMRQARLVLLAAGLIDSVQAAINSLPSPQKEKAQIEWEYSNEVQRHNGFVASLAPALGLADAQIDAMFMAGAAL